MREFTPMLEERPTQGALRERFERRAIGYRIVAAIFFGLITCLLVFGGYVFFSAAQITTADIAVQSTAGLESSIRNLRNAALALGRTRDAYASQFDLGQRALLDVLGAELALYVAQKRVALAEIRIETKRNIDMPLETPSPNSSRELQVIVGLAAEYADKSSKILEQVKQLDSSGTGSLTDVREAEVQVELANAEFASLQAQLAANPNEGTSEVPNQSNDVGSYAQLIQTNVTRFGTLLVVFFFVSILIPLYRYSLRLATFYASVSDIILFKESNPDIDLATLALVLSPTVDFGKQPDTPMQQVVDVIREVVAGLKR